MVPTKITGGTEEDILLTGTINTDITQGKSTILIIIAMWVTTTGITVGIGEALGGPITSLITKTITGLIRRIGGRIATIASHTIDRAAATTAPRGTIVAIILNGIAITTTGTIPKEATEKRATTRMIVTSLLYSNCLHYNLFTM